MSHYLSYSDKSERFLLFLNLIAFKKDYPDLTPTAENQQEYLTKLQEYLQDFFKVAVKAPDVDGIMVAKDTVVDLLCKVCYILYPFTLQYLFLLKHHTLNFIVKRKRYAFRGCHGNN